MSLPDFTLITANFFINDSTRTIEKCINNMEVILSVPCYLVIYCNSKIYPFLKERRVLHGLDHLTVYKVQELGEIWTYKYFEKIQKNREIYWPTRDSRAGVGSHMITCNKADFVVQIIKENPFNTSKFGWIDSSIGENGKKISENFSNEQLLRILSNITDKFRIQILDVCDKKYKLKENKREYYQQYRWVVCGSMFTTGSEKGIKILERLKEIFIETTENGYGHGEEMLFLEILDEFYDDIDRVYGDYGQILNNFIEPTRNLQRVSYIIDMYLHYKYFRECHDCCNFVLNAIETNRIQTSWDFYAKIMCKFAISSWYYLGQEKTKEVVERVMNLQKNNLLFRDAFVIYEKDFKFVLDALLSS